MNNLGMISLRVDVYSSTTKHANDYLAHLFSMSDMGFPLPPPRLTALEWGPEYFFLKRYLFQYSCWYGAVHSCRHFVVGDCHILVLLLSGPFVPVLFLSGPFVLSVSASCYVCWKQYEYTRPVWFEWPNISKALYDITEGYFVPWTANDVIANVSWIKSTPLMDLGKSKNWSRALSVYRVIDWQQKYFPC